MPSGRITELPQKDAPGWISTRRTVDLLAFTLEIYERDIATAKVGDRVRYVLPPSGENVIVGLQLLRRRSSNKLEDLKALPLLPSKSLLLVGFALLLVALAVAAWVFNADKLGVNEATEASMVAAPMALPASDGLVVPASATLPEAKVELPSLEAIALPTDTATLARLPEVGTNPKLRLSLNLADMPVTEPNATASASPATLPSVTPSASPAAKGLVQRELVCSKKTQCAQLSSCAEAQFYLMQCHASQLDPDGDGEPCEDTLCATGLP